ncbi:MAG TPA: M17 family peptidase N-terminal domain-containing protein, partial [Beijerinckiaceae bacterium]|nr:M17 family peptidase N-terminal domain-containing protein [Beijerinckiaceae bacterium]
MSRGPKITFSSSDSALHPVAVVFAGEGLALADGAARMGPDFPALLKAAAEGESFTGKAGSRLDLVAPAKVPAARVIVCGIGG